MKYTIERCLICGETMIFDAPKYYHRLSRVACVQKDNNNADSIGHVDGKRFNIEVEAGIENAFYFAINKTV